MGPIIMRGLVAIIRLCENGMIAGSGLTMRSRRAVESVYPMRTCQRPTFGRVPGKLERWFVNEISALVNDGFGPVNPSFLIDLRLGRRFSP